MQTIKERTEAAAALAATAQRLADYAKSVGWTEKKLCDEYPDLGDARTFREIKKGYDATVETLQRHAENYAAVEAAIKFAASVAERTLCHNLSAEKKLMAAIKKLTSRPDGDNRRVVIVEGQPSVGKTTAADIIASRYGSRIMRIEALQVWNDRPNALLAAILGGDRAPQDQLAAFNAAAAALNASRRCVIIDEAHHLGPRTLNTVKALVNNTRSEFVLMAIPTLLKKLEFKNWEESRQIIHNRLSDKITLKVEPGDPVAYFRHRFPALDEETANAAAREMFKVVNGAVAFAFPENMSFVVAVADAVNPDEPITAKTLSRIINDHKPQIKQ